MKQTYILKSNRKIHYINAPNGGLMFHFDKEIYPEISIVRGISIALVKQHFVKNFFDFEDEIELIDKTGIVHEVCSECGSTNVEVKAWVNELDGHIERPDEIDEQDCWCKKCEKHTTLIQSNQNYTLLSNTQS